jgi:hypothetical protein
LVRQVIDREESDFGSIGTGSQRTSGFRPPEPYPDGWIFRIMEIGMHGKNRAKGHLQSGLLLKFTPARIPDVFAPLHMTAGNTPFTRIGTRPPNQKQPVIFHVYYGNTHCGVTVLNLTAMVAIESLTDTGRFDSQLPTAMGTEFKLHGAILRFKKSPVFNRAFGLTDYLEIGKGN